MNTLRRYRFAINTSLTALMVVWQVAQPLQAANRYWDADGTAAGNATGGTGLGGAGTWNGTLPNWWDGAADDLSWVDGDTAIFTGTGGLVTLGSSLSAGGMVFNSNGFTLSPAGAEVLTLTGVAPAITVTSAGHLATINTVLGGTAGLMLNGAGTLVLNGVNTYTGTTTLSSGALRIWNESNLGATSGTLTLAGGTLQAPTVYLGRTVSVTGNSTLDVARNGVTTLGASLTGSSGLTKTGNGELRLSADNTGFAGTLNVDRGVVRLRSTVSGGPGANYAPTLTAATGYTIGTGAQLVVDNAIPTALTAANALSDTAPITLNGGRLSFVSNNGGSSTVFTETVGDVAAAERYSSLVVTRTNSSSAAVLDAGNLTRSGGGVVNFVGSGGTLGSSGNNPRIMLRTNPTLNDGIIGGWAVVNSVDFATYNAANGVAATTYSSTDITTAGATDNVSQPTGSVSVAGKVINALKWTVSGTSTLTISSGTLTLDSGGLILSDNNNGKTITGGTLAANGGGLYVHTNQNTLAINSIIADGSTATALVKDLGGTVTLGASANNTYSGGTYINGGSLTTGSTANRTYLGTGPVAINAALLTLAQVGATSSTSGYTVKNGGQVSLSTNSINWAGGTAGSDLFSIGAASVIAGSSAAANQGLNSLTRVSSLTGTGQVVLAPDSVMAYSAALTGELSLANQAVKNLGTDADIYFGLGTAFTTGSVTVGSGTPFKGLATDRSSRTWTLGSLNVAAGSQDVYLQGLIYSDSSGAAVSTATMTLGDGTTTAGGFTINPQGTGAFNTHVIGSVTLDDDASVFGNAAAPMTFVVEPGGVLQGSRANSLGSGAGVAGVRVLNGGTLQQTSAAGQLAENAFNGSVKVDAGGRLLAQNASGFTGSGTLTFDPGSILHITNATGWSGSQANATILPNSAVVRLGVASIGTTTQPLLTQPSFSGAGIYEVAVATFTTANPAVANTLVLNLNNGGMVTNDGGDRSWATGANGITTVGVGGGTFAASTGTFLNSGNTVSLGQNTLTIGSTQSVAGNAKLGEVRVNAAVMAEPLARIDVTPGATMRIGATNILPDTLTVNIGTGANVNVDNAETVLRVTGTGSLIGDSALTLTDASNYSFDNLLNGTTTGFNLIKQGAGTMTVTNAANTGVGSITAQVGTIKLASGSSIGTGYTLVANATGTSAAIDLNGTTQAAAGLTLQGSTTTSAPVITGSGSTLNLGGTVTYTSTNNPLSGVISVGTLSLGGANRTFNVGNSTTAVDDLTVSSTLSGNAGVGIVKSGAGTLRLDGANNLTGSLEVQGGSVSGNLGSGNLLLNGGTIETSGTFNRNLGTADGEVRWSTGAIGGFAARGGALSVTLGGPDPLVWDSTANFVSGVGQLLLGSVSSDNAVTLTNNIDLNAAVRTVQVLDNSGSTADMAKLSGILSGTGGGLIKSGSGVLELSGANTYTGTTAVTAGTLIVSSIGGTGVASSNLGAGNATLSIGSGTTTAGTLTYTGAGETTDRLLELAGTTTAAATLNSNGTGALTWQGNVSNLGTTKTFTLGGTYTGSANVFSGALNIGTANLAKLGAGTWELTNANTFVNTAIGSSTLDGGTLKLSGAGTLGSGTLTISAGTLNVAGNSDIAATAVTLGGGATGSSATITLGAGRKLTLGGNVTYSATNNNLTSTINGGTVATPALLDFGGATRTFTVGNSTAAELDVQIGSNITLQNGGLIKAGAGTLRIDGTNSLTSVELQAGALSGGISTANLVLNGGVYETSGTFDRALGTGDNQVQWAAGTTGGGFSARGGDLNVTLGSAPSPLVWGTTTNFVPSGAPLIFGSVSADSVVTFTHDIDLNGAARTVQAIDNPASAADKAVLSGNLTNGSITKTGNGTLQLGGTNSFTAALGLNAGILQFSSAANLGGSGTAIALGGGTLEFAGTGGISLSNAITTSATSGFSNTGTGTFEVTSALTMVNSLNFNGTSPLSFTGLLTQSAGDRTLTINNTAGVSFNNINLTDSTTGRTLIFNVAAGNTATINGVVANGGSGASALRQDGPGTLVLNGANTFQHELRINNGKVQVNTTNSAGNQTNSILFAGNTVAGATPTLEVGSGAAYSLGGAIVYVAGGNVTGTASITGPGKLNLLGTRTFEIRPSDGTDTELVVSAEIANGDASARGVTKTRNGTLVFSGANTYTGTTTVNEGTLRLDYSANTGSKIAGGGALSMGGGTLELLGHASTAVAQGATGFTAGAGASRLVVDSSAGGTVALNITGALTATAAGRSIDFVLNGSGSTINVSGATGWGLTNGILGGYATTNSSRFATVSSGNIAGAGVVKNDVSTWTQDDNVVLDGAISGAVNPAVRINSLAIDGNIGSTLTLPQFYTIGSGGVLVSSNVGANATTISGGDLRSTGNALFVHQFNTAAPLTIASSILGTQSVTKSGNGELILDSASNNANGAVLVNRGTLTAKGGNAIGDYAAVTVDAVTGVVFKLADDEAIGVLSGGGSDGGNIDVGTKSLTLNSMSASTFNGNILGSGRIIKTGAGTLTLANINTSFGGSLVINQGQVTLSNRQIANFANVNSMTLNTGTVLLDFDGGTEVPNKIRDTAPVTLINTAGIDGLRAQHNRNDISKTETIGVLNLLGGANTVTLQASASAGTSIRSMTIATPSIARSNRATLVVRGNNLGDVSGTNLNTGRLVPATLPTTTGGAGAAGTTSISIVPWAIGETTATGGTTHGIGNSFVTAVATTGFRPLNTTTEYEQLVAAGGVTVANNVRYSAGADLTLDSSTARTMNALLVENTGGAGITLAGAGATLNVVSGAFLALGAQPITINGFANITTGTPNEYIFHVPNAATSLTIGSPFTTATAALTKSGAGTLVLTSTGSTFSGPTTINQGVLQIDSLNKLGNNGGGGFVFNGGTLRFGAAFDPSVAVVTLGVPATADVVTTLGGTFDTNGFDITFSKGVGNGGNGGLTKIGAGVLTMNGVSNYSGVTSINAGTVRLGVANALPATANISLGLATLDLGGFTTTLGDLTVADNGTITASAPVTFGGQVIVDGSNARTLTINNTGLTSFTGNRFALVSIGTTARTLTLAGSGNVSITNEMFDGTAAGSLLKTSTGTLTFGGNNSYTGTTTVDAGSIVFTANQNLAGALRFGNTTSITNAVSVDLDNVNAAFGGLTVQNNSATANTITVDAGKTLTINGAVSVASGVDNANTALTVGGGGALVVNGSTFTVGNNGGGTGISSKASMDLSGLSAFTATLSGALTVQLAGDNDTSHVASLTLSNTANTITAASVGVGVSSTGSVNLLNLGAGTNVINASTINIGTGGRDGGNVSFNGNATGTLVIRDTAGTGKAAFNMGTGSATTGVPTSNFFDVTGHNANLLLGAVNIGTQASRTSALTSTFSFDQGTLSMDSLNLSSKGSAGVTTSTFNIGGGTVTSGPITMATTTTAAAGAVANLNIRGGSVTMTGNILKGGGAGTDTANFELSGASTVLDMGGFTLGGAGAAALDNVTFAAGTIRNMVEFNGGAMLVKTTPGTLIFDGANTYTGGTAVEEGRVIAAGGANNRLGSGPLMLGAGTTSGVVQLGDAAGASNQTVTMLSTSGTGTTNAIVAGNAAVSTLTVNQSSNSVFNGALGGVGANENNLNLVKSGVGELVIGGARTYTGSTSVLGGKLFVDGFAGTSATTAGLTLADGTEFALRGSSPAANVVYGFSGTGNVVTVGSSTGATLGFALDGLFNTQLNLAAGQTMAINGTLTTSVYVNSAPTAGQQYVLINGADDGSIFGSGTFNPNPVVFNGGSFTYALSQITAGAGEKWVLTPTAQAAAADVWWKGDLTGVATGVWSASLTSGTGAPTNWDDSQGGNVDAIVPPDSGSIVHFSATGAGNFTTTLGADLTIQELFFHAGATPISVGSSGGINTLTLGNATEASGLTLLTGAPNVSFSANIALAKAQDWNIADAASTLTLSSSLSGVGPLTLNGNGSSTGSLILTGANGLATHSGGTSLVAGQLVLEGGADDRLPVSGALTMGDATTGATLQLGDAVNGASNTTIGSLASGSATTNAIVNGATASSTLTVVQTSAGTFNGSVGGGGANQNNLTLIKLGAAMLTLNGANTYTGATTVNAGTLRLGSAGSLSGSTILVNAIAGSTAAFDVNGRVVTLTGGVTLGGADGSATAQILDTATGGVINLGGNVLFDATNNPLGASIAAGLNLGAVTNRTFTANNSTNAATDLTVSGTVTTGGATIASGTGLVLDGTGTGLLSGAVSLVNGSTDGANADLTKNGTGTWTITGTVSVGDDFAINAGVINVDAGGSLTFNAANTSSPNMVLDTSGMPIVNFNTANAIVGNSTTNVIYVREGATVNFNADNAIGSSIEELRLGDDGQGTGNVVMNANVSVGILSLGFNSASELGNVTGTGTLGGLATLNLHNGMVSANLSGTAGAISKDSLSVILSGNNSLGTGTTLVREGNLTLDFATANAADSKIGTGALTMGSTTANDTTATLTLNGNATASSLQTVGNVISAGGPSDITLVANGGQNVVLRATGTLTRSSGTLNINVPNANTRFEYTGSTVNTNGIVGGWLTLNNSDFATISGGELAAAAYTTANNPANWRPGQNITNSAAFAGTVSPIATTINSLRFDAAAASTISVADLLMVTSGGLMVTGNVGASTSTITGGTLASSSGQLFVHQNNTAATLMIESNIIGSPAITKNGPGLLVLSGRNATGAVNVDEGILRLVGGNALSDTSGVTIRSVTGTGLEITAGVANSETIGSLSGDGSLGQVIVGAGAVLTINQTSSQTFAGVISGAGGLTKAGASTLTITGDASLSGPVILNLGRITLSGGSGRLDNASSYTLNAGEFVSVQDQSSAVDRISNTTTITLNNTAGANGLWVQRTANDSTGSENVGPVTIGAGHNVMTAEATTGTGTGNATLADLVADTLNRTTANHPTVLVRGLNLGATASGARRGFIRFDSGGQTAVNGFEVGGGGAAGALNISIIPWMVGDVTTAGLGNSFVTNIDGTTGLRPLTTAEYTTNAAGFNGLTAGVASTNNVRFDTGVTLTGTATAINSLVIDAATAQTVNGPNSAIEITSGAILAAGAGSHNLGGFSAITTGGSRDYTVFVTNSATQTFTINSALTANVPLVKAGAGILSLTSSGNAFTDLYLNQGFVQADALEKLGSGQLRFFGGGVRLAATFGADISTKIWDINSGGGTLDVSLVTAGVTLANGLDDATPSASDTLNIMTRSSTTGSTGLLTIQGSSTFIGTTIINHSAVSSSTVSSVILNGATNAAINGNLQVGNVTSGTPDVVVGLGADEQIVDTAVLSFVSGSGAEAYFKLSGRTETVAGISAVSRGVIENFESSTDAVAGNGKLIVNSDQDYSYTGYLRDRLSGTGGTLAFEKQGTGTQTLIGSNVIYTGQTTITGGTLRLVDATGFASPVLNNSNLVLERTSGTWNFGNAISGSGGVTKTGNGTLNLTGNHTYSGPTHVTSGTLDVNGTLSGAGAVTVNVDGTLGGGGSLTLAADTNVTVNGTLAVGSAGDSAAKQLTINTSGTGQTVVNGVVAFDLFSGQTFAGENPASANDQVVATGANGFTMGSGATLRVTTSIPIDSSWVVGASWRLFDWSALTGGVTGTFSNVQPAGAPYFSDPINLPNLDSIGLAWHFDAGVLTVVAPEPSRMLLLFFGLMGIWFRRRR